MTINSHFITNRTTTGLSRDLCFAHKARAGSQMSGKDTISTEQNLHNPEMFRIFQNFKEIFWYCLFYYCFAGWTVKGQKDLSSESKIYAVPFYMFVSVMFQTSQRHSPQQRQGLSLEVILFESLFIHVCHLGFFLTFPGHTSYTPVPHSNRHVRCSLSS